MGGSHSFPVAEAAERIRRQRRQREADREARRRAAQRWAGEVAIVLANADESVERIIGFRSTFEEWRTFRMDSDIDLGVIGFDREFSYRVDELMRFRHLFQNLYQTPLVPEKVDFANKSAEGLLDDFRRYHDAFDSFLRELKKALEG